MTTYYVSSGTGSDNNAGTATTDPLATLQAAANLVKPGDTVLVMNGTYTGPAYGNVLTITTSGTASAPITFEAAPGQTPVIDSSGAWNGINIQASYIVINGFTVVGDAANYNLQTALANYSTGNPSLDGNGIVVTGSSAGGTGAAIPNHITIENNTVYNEPGGGIGSQGADYVQILNNVVYDNAHWSAFGNSGISVNISANSDTNSGVHDLISGNLSFGNTQLVPSDGVGTITDGEGIILDTNPGYVGEILVQNNTTYGNSGAGIESFLTDNAVITGNTSYGNDTNPLSVSAGQIFINQSNNNTVTNNVTTAPNGTPPAAPVISGDTLGYGNSVTLTGTAQAFSTVTVFDNSTKLGTALTNSSGAWTFTTGALANGSQSFTATATDSVGDVSPLSSPLLVTLNLPVNLVANGNFATGDFTSWTLGGNYTSSQIFITPDATGGSANAAGVGSMGADGTLSQTIATTPGQTYTLSFWLRNEGSGGNDFAAKWNGQTLLSLTNATEFGYTQYTYTVTATGSTSTLQFSAANNPSQWDLDNISLTAPAPPTGPTVSSVTDSPSTGDLNAGKTVTLTLKLSSAVTVAGGTPTLTLNDGGTATYTGGSGTSALTFSYTVGSSDSNVASLAAATINLNGASIKDSGGNAASLSLGGITQAGPQIDTNTVISAIAETPSSGDLNAGKTVTYTLTMNEVVTVNTAGGSPTLTFNDGGTGTYVSGSGTNALTFSYTVLAGQNTPDLVVSAVNLNGATVMDGAGNVANLSLTGVSQGSPQIDTTPPTVSSVTGTAGTYNAANTLTLTLNMSEAVNVTGTPTLTLNDGGTATYASGSGGSALTFSYTVASGQNTAGLAVTAVNGTIADLAGNALTTANLPATFAGVVIDTTIPSTLNAPVNLVANGNFATGDFTNWTLGGNYTSTTYGSEIYITTNATGGSTNAAGMGSIGADGTLSQTIATTPGQSYTLSFWLQNEGSGGNDFAAKWNGQTLLSLSNAAQSGYTQYTYTVTATGSTSTLQFSAANGPSEFDLDNISLTAPAPPTGPTVSSVTDSPSTGDLNAGKSIALTMNLSSAVTVAGGTPTLTLNDGGTATYVGGSGTNALTFSYTVGASDSNVASLAATAVNLNGATIKNGSGNAASLSLGGITQSGPQIDTSTPVVSAIAETPSSGSLNAGKTVTYTLTMNEAVTVNTSGGSPTLALNDGGTATYVSGSGTNALTLSYTVLAGQNTPDLTVSAFNLNGATIVDGAGNAAKLSLTGIAQGSPQIDTTPPTVSSVSATAGSYNAGKTLTLMLNMSEAVTVTGTPTLTLNDGGIATYAGGSGSSALTFSYAVASGQNTAGLAVTAVNGTIADLAGNALSTANLPETFAGVVIDTATPSVLPTVTSVVASGTGITAGAGDLGAGSVVTLTVNLNEAVTVSGRTPTLTLNDGGTASYTGGSGTNALTFKYTVAAGQNTADLAVTAVNLNGASVKDGAGNAINSSGAVTNPVGVLQIDTTAPTVAQVAASPSSGEVTTSHTVFITLNMSEAVTVTGAPTLLLNDGGTATYDATRSSANAIVFDYTVGSRQVTTDLQVSGITLPTGSSIRDLAGNSAVPTGAGADLRLKINTAKTGVAGASGGNLTIANGAELELFGASNANVTFQSGTGELKLDDSLAFTGHISGLTAADALDLSDVSYGANTSASFSGNTKGGTLTVTDGSHTAKIALLGNYLSSGWTLSSDGSGGTVVVDPPLFPSISGSDGNANGVGDIFTQRLALLVSHMASNLAASGVGESGMSMAGRLDSVSHSNSFLAQPVQQHFQHG